jgi:hypothetical protein
VNRRLYGKALGLCKEAGGLCALSRCEIDLHNGNSTDECEGPRMAAREVGSQPCGAPGERHKNGKPRSVPLNEMALTVFRRQSASTSDGVCLQGRAGDLPPLDVPAIGSRVQRFGDCLVAPGSLDLASLPHRQVVLAVQPPHALVVDRMALAGEQVVDPPVAEAPAFLGELDDARAQLDGPGVDSRRLR